jgi:hypothetical protein
VPADLHCSWAVVFYLFCRRDARRKWKNGVGAFPFHEFIEVQNERRDPFFVLPVEAADAIPSKDEKYGKFLGHDPESRDFRHVPEFRVLFI